MSWLLYEDTAVSISEREKLEVGRGRSCHLVVLDCLASRRHATIVYRNGSVSIIDGGSRNGTIVNGTRVEGIRALRDRDRIVIGASEIRFSTEPPTPSRRRRSKDEAGFVSIDEENLSTVTGSGTGMMLLSALFTKAIDGGELDQALQIITSLSERSARAASAGTLARAELVPVTEMVLRFAAATDDIRWVEWLLRVHARLKMFPEPYAAKRMYNLGTELELHDPSSVDIWIRALEGRAKTNAQRIAFKHVSQLLLFAEPTKP